MRIYKALKSELSKPFDKYHPLRKIRKLTKADYLLSEFKKEVGINIATDYKNGCFLCTKNMEC